MPTSYSTLLGLALPVTGELSGTWGDEVNNYITQYLDSAVAGVQTISGSQTAVTLSRTTNAALSQAGSGSTGSSQYQIINCTGNPASALTVTVPSTSKVYVVLNNTSTNQTVTVKPSAAAGVTVAAARAALIAWNGTDFELVATDDASKMNGVLAAANGGTGQSSYTVGDILFASGSTTLSKLADVATGNALISGGVGVAPSYGKIGLTTHVSGTLPIANGGTNATATPTGGAVAYGTGTAYAFTSAGTSGQVLTSAGASAPTWTTATNANTASAIVQRDASGNFSAGTITASLSGTATQVSNSLTLATSGTGLSGSATFNGASAQTFTVTSNATSANTASTIVARDASGNFSAGTITATLSGNATNVSGTVAVANGGTGATTAATARTNLGGTTVGINFFTLANPTAVTFPRINADNSVSALDAATFRSAIGAGTGSGSVTSVGGTGTVNGITLSGTVTSSGNLTLGGTLSGVSLSTQVTGTLPVANGGTGATDAATARSNLGAGTVTSVSGTGTVQGLTLSGSVTSSGSLTLGGSLSAVSLTTQVSGTLPVANGGTGVTSSTGSGSVVLSTSPSLTTPALGTPSSGNLTNTTVDGTNKVGYRNLPPVGTKTASYTLAVGDVGKYVQLGTSGAIVIPTSTFAEGDAITLFNNTTGNITITCSAPTAYIAGTNTVKTSMTLATRGVATILFISATLCVVTGNVT